MLNIRDCVDARPQWQFGPLYPLPLPCFWFEETQTVDNPDERVGSSGRVDDYALHQIPSCIFSVRGIMVIVLIKTSCLGFACRKSINWRRSWGKSKRRVSSWKSPWQRHDKSFPQSQIWKIKSASIGRLLLPRWICLILDPITYRTHQLQHLSTNSIDSEPDSNPEIVSTHDCWTSHYRRDTFLWYHCGQAYLPVRAPESQICKLEDRYAKRDIGKQNSKFSLLIIRVYWFPFQWMICATGNCWKKQNRKAKARLACGHTSLGLTNECNCTNILVWEVALLASIAWQMLAFVTAETLYDRDTRNFQSLCDNWYKRRTRLWVQIWHLARWGQQA